MNEEALKTMYSLAQKEGYKDSVDDFKNLLSSNTEALNTMYSLAQKEGYEDSIEDFSSLMGVKKKDSSQPYQPSSEKPTSEDSSEVSRIPSEDTDLGVYPTAFTPKEDIEAVAQAEDVISGERLKRKGLAKSLQDDKYSLVRDKKLLISEISDLKNKLKEDKSILQDYYSEYQNSLSAFRDKYGQYFDQDKNSYVLPEDKDLQASFSQDLSVVKQLEKDYSSASKTANEDVAAYRNSANKLAINTEALAQRGTPIGTLMTNLVSEGIPSMVGGLGAFAVDIESYRRPDLLALRRSGDIGSSMVELQTAKAREQVQAVQDDMSRLLYDNIGIHVGSTKEYIQKQTEEGDFWNIASGGLGTSIPAMLTAGLTGGASFYAQMYDFADDAVKDIDGLSEDEKVAYKGVVAATVGALEKYGFRNILQNKTITNSIVGKVLKRLPTITKGKSANVSDDFIKIVMDEGKAAQSLLGRKLGQVATRTGSAALSEAETGGLQSLAENTIEQGINAIKGEEVFDKKDLFDITNEFLFDAAAEAVGGAFIGGVVSVFSKASPTNKELESVSKYLKDINIEAIGARLDADVAEGVITKEEAKVTYDKIKQYKQDLDRLPEDIPEKDRAAAVALIQQRNGLQRKLGRVDEAFKPNIQEKIDDINAKLAEMGSVSDDVIAAKEAEEELSFFEDMVEGGASEARRVYDAEQSRVDKEAEEEVNRIVSEQEAIAEAEAQEAQRKANIEEATVSGQTMAVETESTKPSKREGDKKRPKDLTKTEGEQDFTEAERPTPITSAPSPKTPEQEKISQMVAKAREARRAAREKAASDKNVEDAVKTPFTSEVSDDIGPEVDFVTDDELADAMVQGAETPFVNEKILNILDKAIDATSSKGRAFDATLGLPMFIANSSLKIVRAAYKGGMSLADAIKRGYDFVRNQGYDLDMDAFDAYVKQNLTGKKETDAISIEKASEVSVQPEAEVVGEMEEGVPDTEPQEATQEGKKPRVAKDKKTFTNLIGRVFGLNKGKSKAVGTVADRIVGTIAERAGITKEEAYRRIGLVKERGDFNISDPIRKISEVYEQSLTDQERADIEAWSGNESGTVEFSEAFARGFEKYLQEGNAPTDKLKKVFENFKKWLTEIYKGVTDLDIELNDKMRGIYDAMLEGEATPENIRVAQTKVQLPSIKEAMPFLDGFDITKLTEDQINLLNEVMETYLETGNLVGDGTIKAIVEGIQGAESNGPNAKMTADSLDIKAGEYLNLIAAIMGRAKSSWIRLQRELGLTGENGLTIALNNAAVLRNNWNEIIHRLTDKNTYEKGTESKIQVVGIVLQRIGQIFENGKTVEEVINDVLDDFQRTAEYIKVYGDPSLGDYASEMEKAVAKVRGSTTAEEVMAKLSPKEKELMEAFYEANNIGLDEKVRVSDSNGRPLNAVRNYLHIPIRRKTIVEPENGTPTDNTLSNPAQISISNAFAPQSVSTKSTGAQQRRLPNAHKLPEGSYYDPRFFIAQHNSFNNTNVAIFTYQAIQKMNAFLSTGDAVDRFGGGKRGRSNIEAFQRSVNQALNAESLSAKASFELREFEVSGVKVGEALNKFQRFAKQKAIVWVMARAAQYVLQAPVYINTIGHVLTSPLMLKNPVAAMSILGRSLVFQSQTWTKEKGWKNRQSLPWADLIKLAPAGIRDIRESFAFMEGDSESVISRRSGMLGKVNKVYERGDDIALKYSVAVIDRAAAQMSWLALYETYMFEKGLVEGVDMTNRESYNEWWKSQGQNPNYDAIAYADTMVAKDQNASSNFQRAILQTDKSAIEKIIRSLIFPLINFKINKIQSIRSDSKIISTINKKVTAQDRVSAVGRLLFTAAEMAAYHQASIFLVGAWKELVDFLWKEFIARAIGDDDEEMFDEDDIGKTIKNEKRFWTRWITESSPLLSTLNIDQRIQNGMAEAYNFMCYQYNKQIDASFASQYPEYESYARSGEAPAKVEFMDEGIGNAGYLGIVVEQAMTIEEMWEAAISGEREDKYGNMIYYTPDQQQGLKLTAILATVNAAAPSYPLTAEVFGMVNRSFYKTNNRAYDNMLARDLEVIGKGISEEDARAIMNSYIQTTYKDLFEQEGMTALADIGENLNRDVKNNVRREVLKESFKSIHKSKDAKINEFLVRASRGGSPRDKANKIFARIKALDKMGEVEQRDKLAYEAYVLSLSGITVGKDEGLSIVLLLDSYNQNNNVLDGKSFLELSTEMSKK